MMRELCLRNGLPLPLPHEDELWPLGKDPLRVYVVFDRENARPMFRDLHHAVRFLEKRVTLVKAVDPNKFGAQERLALELGRADRLVVLLTRGVVHTAETYDKLKRALEQCRARLTLHFDTLM